MKLAAIWNIWDGDELLEGSVNCVLNHVDELIFVYQNISNFGEVYSPDVNYLDVHLVPFHPFPNKGAENETSKRNMGIQKARELGCTHFLHMDCDEYYQDFGQAKQLYIESKCAGSVVRLHTYFKNPTWRLETDENYFVPFIHPLRPDTFAGGRNYPFRVDPTRRINETDVVELPIHMHHYSWVRKDIERKVRNSSARANLMKSKHLKEYNDPNTRPGTFLECYNSRLIEVPNYFNIQI